MFKVLILKFLSFILLLFPGNPTSKFKPRHLYLNFFGFLSLLGFGVVIYWNFMNYINIISKHMNTFLQKQSQKPNINSNVQRSLPPPVILELSTLPPPPDDGVGPQEVSKFTDIFYKLMGCTLNAILRIVIWVMYPDIVCICQRLAGMKLCPKSMKWTWNEICLVIISIGSLTVSQVEFATVWTSRKGKGAKNVDPIPNFIIVMGHLQGFLGESFGLDIMAILLVGFITLVTINLEDATENFYLGDPSTTSAWSLNRPDIPVEQTRAYQIAKFLQLDPPRKFINVNKKLNNSSSEDGRNTTTTGGLPSIIVVNQLINSYFEWTSIWKQASTITGLVTFILFLKLTLSVSFLSFLSITSILDHQKINIISWTTFSDIPLVLFNIGTLICIGNTAFRLNRMSENLQLKILQKFWSSPAPSKLTNQNLSYSQNEILAEKHLSMLLENLAQSSINLSGLGFFTVSRSTLTSILGVIITYLVVLIQFRTSSVNASQDSK